MNEKRLTEFAAMFVFIVGIMAGLMIYVAEGWHKQLAMLTVLACVIAILLMKSPPTE